jgi:hypothetical protein
MKKETPYLSPTFGNYKALITKGTSKRVKQINDFILDYFAKKSIVKHGFFPVLRIIKSRKIYIKLYFYRDRIRNSKREIEDFLTQFYKSEIIDLSYLCCNIMEIHLNTNVTAEAVNSCKSMDELELIFLNTLTNDSYVSISSDNPNEGGLTVYQTFPCNYYKWKKLLEEDIETENETKVDSLHTEKTQEADGDEKMTNEEWLEFSNEIMAILGVKERTFTDAGKCFVMPYKKPK